jgi:pimeloyl-ACP methyl ester carboxylesterase
MPTLPIPKGTMHYEVDGPADAPWALVLPGAATGAWMYDPLRQRFAQGFRTVTLEYRGIGASENDLWQVTPGRLADDILLLLDHLGVPRTHVVGFSLGTFVMAELLHRQPGRFDRCIVGCMPCVRDRWRVPEGMAGKALHEDELEIRSWSHVKYLVLPMFFSTWFQDTQPERYRGLFAHAEAQSLQEIMTGVQQFAGVFGHDWNRFRVFDTLPAGRRLFVTGETDFIAHPDDVRAHPLTAKGPTVVLRKSGHVFFYEQPGTFCALAMHFWEHGTLPEPLPGGGMAVRLEDLPGGVVA